MFKRLKILVISLNSTESWKQVKIYATLLFLCLLLAVYLISAISDDDFVSLYVPSIFYHVTIRGHTRRNSDICACIIVLFTFAKIIIYVFSKTQTGFDLFRALKNEIDAREIRLDVEELRLLQKKYGLIKKSVMISEIALQVCCFAAMIGPILLFFPASNQSFGFLFLVDAIAMPAFLIVFHNLFQPITHLLITSYYFTLRIRKQIFYQKTFIQFGKIKSKAVNKLVTNHHEICRDIARYSQFWKVFYFLALISMIPLSGLVLQYLLFGTMAKIFIAGYFAVYAFTVIYVFVIGMSLARISHQLQGTRLQLTNP